jgi:fermentation-respiration switch protein FrsA (DUF1100 family)
VIDQLQAERPLEAKWIVLFGASLGGAIALATADLRQPKSSSGIDAIVLDCPIADYRHALATHAARLGAPRAMVMPLALAMAQTISRARFDEVRGVDLLAGLRCPVMVIQSEDDDFVGGDAERIVRAFHDRDVELRRRSVLWQVAGAAHLMAIVAAPDEYRLRVADFINDRLRNTST